MSSMSNNPMERSPDLYPAYPRPLGFRYKFLNITRGRGVLNSFYIGNQPLEGPIEGRQVSSIIAHETGTATTFGLKNAEERGQLFIAPGTEVYEGMLVGETQRPQDLTINVAKKNLTNMRQSIRDLDER